MVTKWTQQNQKYHFNVFYPKLNTKVKFGCILLVAANVTSGCYSKAVCRSRLQTSSDFSPTPHHQILSFFKLADVDSSVRKPARC